MNILNSGDYAATTAQKGERFLAGTQIPAAHAPGDRRRRWHRPRAAHGDVQARRLTPDRDLADRMFQEGLSGELPLPGATSGLILDIGGYYKNVITLAPSLDISTAEIEEALHALDLVIRRAKAGAS
jgi:acetylornithine/succinyldiaminopimelate/putrescine aminotransferase